MSDEERPHFVIPESGIYQINGGWRGLNARGFDWIELVKGKSWDDPDAQLIDLKVFPPSPGDQT